MCPKAWHKPREGNEHIGNACVVCVVNKQMLATLTFTILRAVEWSPNWGYREQVRYPSTLGLNHSNKNNLAIMFFMTFCEHTRN